MLSYLASCTSSDMSMASHQAAKLSSFPKDCHGAEVKRIGICLKSASNEGLIFAPDLIKGLEVYVGADFACGFDKYCGDDLSSTCSRACFVIKHAGCHMTLKSKL